MKHDPRFSVPTLWPLAIAIVLFAVGGTTVFYSVPLLTLALMLLAAVFFVAGIWSILFNKSSTDTEWSPSWTDNR